MYLPNLVISSVTVKVGLKLDPLKLKNSTNSSLHLNGHPDPTSVAMTTVTSIAAVLELKNKIILTFSLSLLTCH